MSKQEKLAAFLSAYEYFVNNGTESGAAQRAFNDYRATPDDPPPRPEMPECVKELVESVCNSSLAPEKWRRLANKIYDHYAQPLRLEVGKVYEDGAGEVVDIVWHDPKVASHFVGVFRRTGEPDRYRQDGSCCGGTASENLIREVTNG